MTPAKPDEVFVDGRKYVRVAAAARIVQYGDRNLRYLIDEYPDEIRTKRDEGVIYICLSDLLTYLSARDSTPTKTQQIANWWRTHPTEASQIKNWRDFHRRLKRDGIDCSPALVRTFMAKVAPADYMAYQILEWMEQKPERRLYTSTKAKCEILKDLRIQASRSTIKRAQKKYDKKHGAPKPPFEPERYVCTREAAEIVGVSRSLITMNVADGKLLGQMWCGTMYISRESLAQRFSIGGQ